MSESTTCAIVGGGPAGMVLGLLLARAGVEVTLLEKHADFLRDAPEFESLLVRDGVKLLKLYLSVGREMQLTRFHERRHNPLKRWKFTDIDQAAIAKWDDYTEAKSAMFFHTDTADAPWTVVKSDDKKRARIAVIQTILNAVDYAGKDKAAIGKLDGKICGGPKLRPKD